MENKENKKSKIVAWLSTSASIIGLIVGIWSIGINFFLFNDDSKECPIEKFDDWEKIQFANKENVHSIMAAIEREKLGDNIYCSNFDKLFNKKSQLDKANESYLEAKRVYLNLQARNKELDDRIKELQKKLIDQEERLIAEINGTGGSGKVGAGLLYKKQRDVYERYKIELDSLVTVYDEREEFYSKSITELDKKIQKTKE